MFLEQLESESMKMSYTTLRLLRFVGCPMVEYSHGFFDQRIEIDYNSREGTDIGKEQWNTS